MLIEHRYEMRCPRPAPFALYGALSRVLPEAHRSGWTIAPCHVRSGFVIRGPDTAPDPRSIYLGGRSVPVRLVESAELYLATESAIDLWSPIVVIRLTAVPPAPAEFRSGVERNVRERCEAMGVVDVHLGVERTIRVHGRGVRGFEVRARCQQPGAAALLSTGIGGKRSMGCGVFHDARSPWR